MPEPYWSDDSIELYHGDLHSHPPIIQATDALVGDMAGYYDLGTQASAAEFSARDADVVLDAFLRLSESDDQISVLGLKSEVWPQRCRYAAVSSSMLDILPP